MKKEFEKFRPQSFVGNGDKYLYPLITKLSKVINQLENQYAFDSIKLDKKQNYIMSNLLIEFAEDLHNDIGLWKSIEYYNNSMFNTPFPLFVSENYIIENIFDINRIKYFIYTIFYEFDDELIISPENKDLDILAKGVSDFLSNKFDTVPKGSSIKLLLHEPNNYGWDFKRKLVWTGISSYLFRYNCIHYVNNNNNGKMEIGIVDDYICQENTYWSGLGVIDILTKALELPDAIQIDIRSWYERFISFYKVISQNNNVLIVNNIVNDQIYKVQIDDNQYKFKKGHLIFGGIVPYGEYFYWSGIQTDYKKLNDREIIKIKSNFIKKSTRIVYRYDKKLANKAFEDIKIQYNDFKDYFENDLMHFKDGHTMVESLQNKDKQKYEKLLKEESNIFTKKKQMKPPVVSMNFPEDILNTEDGIAVYFNPDKGMEIMIGFNHIKSGFVKKGINLTDEEKDAIRNFIYSEAISPNFVMKLIEEYGDKSIASSFLINSDLNFTSFLFHKYKGHFFRNVYPEISYNIE